MQKKTCNFLSHNGYSLLELVFVIVVIGTIASAIIPTNKADGLKEAAVQVASHIRYTQHLAIVNDKFNRADSHWYKKRWQIHFSNTLATKYKWTYTIFSDYLGESTGNPDPDEIAVNPLDASKRLTGGYSGEYAIHFDHHEATKDMNLGIRYNIIDVDFIGGCSISKRSQRIFFDNLGRPYFGNPRYQDGAYDADKLLKSTCIIELCSDICTTADESQKVRIKIEQETGYVHIE